MNQMRNLSKNEDRKFQNIYFRLMLMALLFLASGLMGKKAEAASIPQNATIPFTDGSENCLTYRGQDWYLTGKSGKALTGIRYLKINKKYSLKTGFYEFDRKGRLVQEKAVYKLNKTVHGVTFNGYYYTDASGRFRNRSQGLKKLSNLKCGAETFNGYYYVQEHGKLSAPAQVRELKTKVSGTSFNGYYYFDKYGKLLTTKKFRTVKPQKVGGIKFNGSYYFGGENGALVRKKGWITYKNEKYYISSNGKKLTDQWKDGRYLLSDGTIAICQYVPDGSYVGYDGKKCSKKAAMDDLKNVISSMTSSYGGTWSVYVKDLKTGVVMNYNERKMSPASTIKIFCMASVYDQIKSGKMEETSTVNTLLKNMITISDNESFNELVRRQSSSRSFLSGASVINEYLKKNGYKNTEVHSALQPSSTSNISNGSNASSAKDCGLLLEQIYNGTCVSKSYSKKMLNLLLQQQRRSKIPAGLPSGIQVANKTGETSTVEHDVAIVYGEKTDYIICAFSSGSSSAVSKIKNISRTVYNYLN